MQNYNFFTNMNIYFPEKPKKYGFGVRGVAIISNFALK